MTLEELIKNLKNPNELYRRNALKELVGLAKKGITKKKFLVVLKALRYTAYNDTQGDLRLEALNTFRELKARPPAFLEEKKNLKVKMPNVMSPVSKIIFALFIIVFLLAIASKIINMDLGDKTKAQLEEVKQKNLDEVLNPLNVDPIVPAELKDGISLAFKPELGSVFRSHIEEKAEQRSGGRDIGTTVVSYDLKQKVVKILSDSKYVMEYTTSNVKAPTSIKNMGLPDPGEVLKKTIDEDGVVQEISGDIFGIVPAFAFMNKYAMPKETVTVGKELKSVVSKDDIKAETVYKFEKVIKIKDISYLYVTYVSNLVIDSLDFETTVTQKAQGEIYLDYFNHSPVYMKETSLMVMKKPDSQYGYEIKSERIEKFAEASDLFH